MQDNNDVISFLSDLEEFVNASAILCESWMKLDNDLQDIINDKTEYPLKASFDEIVAELWVWRQNVVKEFESFKNESLLQRIANIIKSDLTDGQCVDKIISIMKANGIEIYKGI